MSLRLPIGLVAFGVLSAALVAPACAPGEGEDDDDAIDAEDSALNSRSSVFLNDVSVLFPLPKFSERDRLLGASTAGEKGELLPQATFDKLPRLVVGAEAARESLRVVGLRIDPCFGVPPSQSPDDTTGCKSQLRLVLQPTYEGEAGALTASDAAVHAFYTMPAEEFRALASELVAARRGIAGSKRTSLGPNPLLVGEGLGGAYAKALAAVVKKHAGKQNLTRVTFMTREASRQGFWKFGGFDIAGARHTKMKVASLGDETIQSFSAPPFGRNGTVIPEIAHDDDVSPLFSSEATTATKQKLAAPFGAALRIQNPTRHSPDTIDCVSCHVATSARLWAEKEKGLRASEDPSAFKTTWNVSLTKSPSSERADNLHSFGYLGTSPSISQRTANESAAVADYVNTRILGRP